MTHILTFSRNAKEGLAKWSTFFFLQFMTFGKAYAQGFGGQLPDIPGTPDTDVRSSITTVLNFILTFLALLAIVFVIVGGFRILAAGGNEENVTKGRKTIIYAIIGLVIIFFARIIVGFFTTELAEEFGA